MFLYRLTLTPPKQSCTRHPTTDEKRVYSLVKRVKPPFFKTSCGTPLVSATFPLYDCSIFQFYCLIMFSLATVRCETCTVRKHAFSWRWRGRGSLHTSATRYLSYHWDLLRICTSGHHLWWEWFVHSFQSFLDHIEVAQFKRPYSCVRCTRLSHHTSWITHTGFLGMTEGLFLHCLDLGGHGLISLQTGPSFS